MRRKMPMYARFRGLEKNASLPERSGKASRPQVLR